MAIIYGLIYPKFQRNKDCLTKLCNVICKGLQKNMKSCKT